MAVEVAQMGRARAQPTIQDLTVVSWPAPTNALGMACVLTALACVTKTLARKTALSQRAGPRCAQAKEHAFKVLVNVILAGLDRTVTSPFVSMAGLPMDLASALAAGQATTAPLAAAQMAALVTEHAPTAHAFVPLVSRARPVPRRPCHQRGLTNAGCTASANAFVSLTPILKRAAWPRLAPCTTTARSRVLTHACEPVQRNTPCVLLMRLIILLLWIFPLNGFRPSQRTSKASNIDVRKVWYVYISWE